MSSRIDYELLISAIEFSPDATLAIDVNGKVVAWNRAIEEMSGVKKSDMLGKDNYEYVIPFYGERRPMLIDLLAYPDSEIKKMYDLVERKGDTAYVEVYVPHVYGGKGAYCWGIASLLFDNEGNTIGAIESLRDITEKKKAEEALKRSEEKYREIFENTIEGIFQTTLDGHFISANPPLAKMLGFSSPEEMLETCNDIAHDFYMDPADRRQYVRRIKENNTIQAFETRLYRKDKSAIWVAINARSIRSSAGSVLYLEGTMENITERKKAEEALCKSEEKYRNIFENAIEGIYQSTTDGHYLTVNPALADMTGYGTPQEMIETVTNIAHQVYVNPKDRSTFENVLDRDGYTKGFEAQLYKKDGTKIWVSLGGFVARDVEGQILYYEGNVIDITTRKLAEKKLRKETSFNRTMIEHSPAFYAAIAPDNRILFMNRSLLNALEYTIDEVIGKDYLSTLIPSEERALLSDIFERITIKQEQVVHENHAIGKNGKSRLIEWHAMPVMNEKNEFEYFFGVGIDITERKKAEKALLDERQKFFLLAENAPFGLALIDDKGRYSYINTKFREMFGYSLHDVPDGRSWCRKAYPDAEYRHKVIGIWLNDADKFKQDPSVKEDMQWRFTVTCKDNTQKDINFIPVQLSTGKYLMTYEDITELNKLQAQLLHSQKMEAIGTLTGGIAHDFNNVLTAVMGYATLAKKRLGNNDQVQQYMDQVLSAAEKAASLTQSLLAFSRKQIISPKPIDLNETIRKAEKLLARLIGEDIELKFSPSSEDQVIIADQTQLEQVLINLVANARDAMPRGGLLSIRTLTTVVNGKFTESHGYGKPGQYALIAVSDKGMGIDENAKGKIFEPFFTTKEIGKGTGLGLSIVYGIVKQHNGYIEVESEPGQGTTFKIYFPLAESAAIKTKPLNATENMQRGKETVFLAEDNDSVRMVIKTYLEKNGYTVIEAINGEDAIVKFKEHKSKTDLVILDVVMPKKNGKEVYEEIKEIAANMPVLFMSGYTYDIIQQKGINSGKMDFIQKPIVHDVFIGKIREMLDKQVTRN